MDRGKEKDPKSYVEFLLKHYHGLKRDLKQMQLELRFWEEEGEADTVSVPALEQALGFLGQPMVKNGDGTAAVAMVYGKVNGRGSKRNRRRLERMIAAAELELDKLDIAIESLPQEQKDVITDLYIKRLTWEQVAIRRYISSNTINRYRRRALMEMSAAFLEERP